MELFISETSLNVNTKIDTLQSFESLLLGHCHRYVTWKNILANFLKQYVYEVTKARTWPQEYQRKTCIMSNKMNSNKKGQSLIVIHKTLKSLRHYL